jgi:RNA polymerase sigma-70 factor (ECF subfamily)
VKEGSDVEDSAIIDLYFARSESAISETQTKYGRMLMSVSMRILRNTEDADEAVNDTYMKTWNSIPPTRPNIFSAFLTKIVRNVSLDRLDSANAAKRGAGEIPAVLDELEECIADSRIPVPGEGMELKEILNAFLEKEKPEARKIFVRRYFFGSDIKEIAEIYGIGESKVKMSLSRSRERLKACLEEEGVTV